MPDRPLVIACGALAGELRAVLPADGRRSRYLPAHLHNRPERIVPALTPLLDEAAAAGAGLRRLRRLRHRRRASTACSADHPGVERLPGAHCYEFFAGAERFAALHDEEPGTFFLTDFLARHFDALVWQGLGLDRHPELRDVYFGNYRRVVLLSPGDGSRRGARPGGPRAERLGLAFEHRHVGRGRARRGDPSASCAEVA